MICQHCKENQANCHISTMIGGKSSELYLCSSCASELGYTKFINAQPFDEGIQGLLADMLGFKPAVSRNVTQSLVCPLCKSTIEDLSRTGRVGCAECYSTFSQALKPYIRRIHGAARHTGRTPKSAGAEIFKKKELTRLKNELKTAVEEQEYERAAQLRDAIREIEKTDSKKG